MPTFPRYASNMPIAQADFWRSLVPKPFRREEKLPDDPSIQRVKPKRSKEWNPATFYIVIFLLIGSMSINMISLRQSFETFMRQTDVRIGLLKDVVERIQRGEEVDVEKALGSGNREKEQEWEDGKLRRGRNFALAASEKSNLDFDAVLREIERDEAVRAPRKERSRGSETLAKANAKADPQQAASETPKTETVKTRQGSGMASFF